MSGETYGNADDQTFEGVAFGATAYLFADAAQDNPSGIGSATWRGLAQGSALPGSNDASFFDLTTGVATVTIPDLSSDDMRVAVDVVLPGLSFESPEEWQGLALSGGVYTTGSPKGDDYIYGIFSEDHSETFGVFETTSHIGSFGAERTN